MGWLERHPNLGTWLLLSAGMLVALAWSARGVEDLTPRAWLWLVVATVAVAGLCAWIVSWEADALDEEMLPEGGAVDEGHASATAEAGAARDDGDAGLEAKRDEGVPDDLGGDDVART